MQQWLRRLALAAALSALTAPAMAKQPGTASPAAGSPVAATQAVSPSVGTDADSAFMAGMAKMNRAMDGAPRTGNPDQDFVAMMIPHHQGAVSMAQVELRYGKDPTLRRLARQIISSQTKEIAEMRHWQATHHS